MQFGIHFMLDCYGADPERLKNKELLLETLKSIPGRVGMYAISEPIVEEVGPNNKKDPGGLSGFVLIAESHISFHTFPSRCFVTIDVYTCQNDLPTEQLIAEFKATFKFVDHESFLQKRGTRYPTCNIAN